MNIPDDVFEQAEALWWDISGDHRSVEALQLVAEWARKEALREAAEAIDAAYKAEHDDLTSPSYLHGLYDARALIRALAEGASS